MKRPDLMMQWAEKNALKKSNARIWDLGFLNKRAKGVPIPGHDHVTCWNRNGKPFCIVSQPYGLDTDDIKKLAEVCRAYSLNVRVDAYPAWHYPGSVVFVLITAAERSDND